MAKHKDKDTRQRIMDAARRIFMQRGMAGTRMQEIADEAGINKAMLHYYFRNKEQLFELIFAEALEDIFPRVEEVLRREIPVREKLKEFVRAYISQVRKHPFVPIFVLHEVNVRPEQLPTKIEQLLSPERRETARTLFLQLMEDLLQAQERGELPPYPPHHLWLNIISLCLFPLLARPLIKHLLQMSDKDFDDFLDQRILMVEQFLDLSLSPSTK